MSTGIVNCLLKRLLKAVLLQGNAYGLRLFYTTPAGNCFVSVLHTSLSACRQFPLEASMSETFILGEGITSLSCVGLSYV